MKEFVKIDNTFKTLHELNHNQIRGYEASADCEAIFRLKTINKDGSEETISLMLNSSSNFNIINNLPLLGGKKFILEAKTRQHGKIGNAFGKVVVY